MHLPPSRVFGIGAAAFLFAILPSAFQPAQTISISSPSRSEELVQDAAFNRGFRLRGAHADGGRVIGVLRSDSQLGRDGEPVWKIAQWHSRGVIGAETPASPCNTLAEAGMWCWSNPFKRIAVGNHALVLSVNSVAEWNGRYRKDEAWPHLLLEQDIARSRPSLPTLGEISALPLSIEYSLITDTQVRVPHAGYDRARHATQFLLYFQVQDLRSEPGDGRADYIWLGVPLFDDRYDFVPSGRHIDSSTRKLIWRIAQQEFMARSILDEPNQLLQFDLLPHAKQALEYAFAQNILRKKSLNFYKIGGMNIGYEMTGLGVTSVRLGKISLKAIR